MLKWEILQSVAITKILKINMLKIFQIILVFKKQQHLILIQITRKNKINYQKDLMTIIKSKEVFMVHYNQVKNKVKIKFYSKIKIRIYNKKNNNRHLKIQSNLNLLSVKLQKMKKL